MAIKTNNAGFTEATMGDTSNGAELHAFLSSAEDDFRVSMKPHGNEYWYFDIRACEEAISFFTMLKEELKRRDKKVRDAFL